MTIKVKVMRREDGMQFLKEFSNVWDARRFANKCRHGNRLWVLDVVEGAYGEEVDFIMGFVNR